MSKEDEMMKNLDELIKRKIGRRKFIDTGTLKQHMRLNPYDWNTPDERWLPEREIGMYIDTCPEADVAEVVRCKDCKEFDKADLAAGKQKCFCFIHGENFPLEYFCADGERRKR